MTCETCKHWDKPGARDEGFGYCRLITDYSDTIRTDYNLAYTCGSYTEESGIYTKPTFGCVLHTPTTPPQNDGGQWSSPGIGRYLAGHGPLLPPLEITIRQKLEEAVEECRTVAPPLAQPAAPSQKTPFECSF